MIALLSFPQHPITPWWILHFAPHSFALAVLTKQEKTIQCCQSFCRAFCGYNFVLVMAKLHVGAMKRLWTDVVEGGGEGLPQPQVPGTWHRKTRRSLKSLAKNSSNFPDLAAVTHPLAHHRKLKEKRQYNGDR